MDFLRYELESIIVGDSYSLGDNLKSMVKFAGVKPKSKQKVDLVDALYDFYNNIGSAALLYHALDKYEHALLTCIVQSRYRPLLDDIKAVAKDNKFTKEKSYTYYSESVLDYFPKNSKLHAFFIKRSIPPLFQEYLDSVIPPYIRQFHACVVDDPDHYKPVKGRERRYKDFDMLLSFVNNNKVAATRAGGYINKTALLKFHKTAGYEEVCQNVYKIEDIRNAGEAIVSFGMAQLLRCADVLNIVQERFAPSQNAIKFSGMSIPEKAKFLYMAYINHGNTIIDECARIIAPKLQFSRKSYSLSGPRREVVACLRECPIGEWIDFYAFSKELRKTNYNMFAVVGEVLERDDYYNQYYNNPSWRNFEHCAISIMLMEYLAVLGAVDVYVDDVVHDVYGERSAMEVRYFRITDLGAYLFGASDSYTEKEGKAFSDAERGFLVQPNFDIVIPQGKDRMQHELFFDRFAEKTTEDDEVSIYKLSFKSMVQALNIGLYIREIRSYCEHFASAAVPDNVITAFTEWETQSSRIRIRTVTVIETDDAILLEEIKNYRGMDALSEGHVTPVLILAPGTDKKAKALIEKNKRFCVNKV